MKLLILPLLATNLLAPAGAQARDPFEPPEPARSAAPSAVAESPTAPAVRHLLQVGGKRYVFDGARRYGVGDRFGDGHIACIVDTGVVVREQGALRLLPIFGGVHKRPSAVPAGNTRPLCPKSTGETR